MPVPLLFFVVQRSACVLGAVFLDSLALALAQEVLLLLLLAPLLPSAPPVLQLFWPLLLVLVHLLLVERWEFA